MTCQPRIKWERQLSPYRVMGDLNWADLSGEGHFRTLVATSDDGKLYSLDGQGEIEWVFAPPGERFASSVSVCQPHAEDPQKLVIVPTRYTKIYALDRLGQVVWQRELPAYSIHGGPACVGLPGSETILYAGDAGRLFALDPRGDLIWHRAASGPIHGTPAAGDVDGDGRAEIYFGCKDAFLYCLGDDGCIRWRAETRRVGDGITTGPILCDIDRDGGIEVVCGSWDNFAYCFDAETGSKRWETRLGGRIRNGLALGDLDGDGRSEILFGDPFGLSLLSSHGEVLWEFRPGTRETVVSAPPVIGDITGDGLPDVVFGTQTGFLFALDNRGKELWSIDLLDEEIAAAPLIADVDGDGLIEVLYGTSHGRVVCLATPSRTEPLWPMGRRRQTLDPAMVPPGIIGHTTQRISIGPPLVGGRPARSISIRPSAAEVQRPGLHLEWSSKGEYPSLKEASPLRLYVESTDPACPVRGVLHIRFSGVAGQYSVQLQPTAGSVVVDVSLAHLEGSQVRRAEVTPRFVADRVCFKGPRARLTMLDPGDLLAEMRSTRTILERLDGSERTASEELTRALAYSCLSYAERDASLGSLGRAYDMARQMRRWLRHYGYSWGKVEADPSRRVTIDGRGVLRLDGKPFFPLGLYLVNSAEDVRAVARIGFNTVFSVGDDAFLKACKTESVMFVGPGPGESVEDFRSVLKLRERMSELRSHPCLLAWYVVDEPSLRNVPVEVIRRACELVKAIDAHHPTLICDGFPYRGLPYQALADIASPCWYPVWKQMSLTTTARCIDDIVRVVPRNEPVWYVVQAWTWRNVRFPTPEEERVMTYLAIIHGARGISWFGYSYPDKEQLVTARDGSPELWSEIVRIVAELRELQDILATERVPPRISTVNGRVDWCLIDSGSSALIIACNPTTRPAQCKFEVGKTMDGQMLVAWEDRIVEVVKGSFKDRFEPLSVHVYRGIRRERG